jgi:molybdate transport system ATP-binding protein
MTISVQLRVGRGAFDLDACFEAPAQGVTSLFGPSGSGKTTLLRCVAGLEHRCRGTLCFDGATWQDDAQGVFVPTHRRRVGYVFQEAALFPHLDVEGNLRYGYKRTPADGRRITFDQAVGWMGVAPLLSRAVAGLSGGERQRVAIARALLASPQLLLLDEPLSALDDAGRQEILGYLSHLHQELAIPILHVSHSVREVARLADYIVQLRGGRIVGSGAAGEMIPRIAAEPEGDEDWLSTLSVRIVQHDLRYHLSETASAFGTFWTPLIAEAPGSEHRIQIRARDVSLALSLEPDSSLINQVPARIAALQETSPGQLLIRLTPVGPGGEGTLLALVTGKAADHLGLRVGLEVFARVKGVGVLK